MIKMRCCDFSGTGFIEVQGRKAGIVGLRQIFEDVKPLGLSDPQAVVAALLTRVKEKNWAPEEMEKECASSLLREYERWRGSHR